MGKTFCSQTKCMYTDCAKHQYNAPKDIDISIADLNDGLCFAKKDFCTRSDCRNTECRFHYTKITPGEPYDIVDLDLGCYVGPEAYDKLLAAICRGTQNTNYACDTVCKAMCGSDGRCTYCYSIAHSIEEEFGLVGARNTGREMPVL